MQGVPWLTKEGKRSAPLWPGAATQWKALVPSRGWKADVVLCILQGNHTPEEHPGHRDQGKGDGDTLLHAGSAGSPGLFLSSGHPYPIFPFFKGTTQPLPLAYQPLLNPLPQVLLPILLLCHQPDGPDTSPIPHLPCSLSPSLMIAWAPATQDQVPEGAASLQLPPCHMSLAASPFLDNAFLFRRLVLGSKDSRDTPFSSTTKSCHLVGTLLIPGPSSWCQLALCC